tara:strand:+ start:504 stop:701 length:198 start_codon:yes stop_codon:yes gene_type:complete
MATAERFKEVKNWIYKTPDDDGNLHDYSCFYTNKEDAEYWYKNRYLRIMPSQMKRQLILIDLTDG